MPSTFADFTQIALTLKNSLEEIGAFLVAEMRAELFKQGHKATGKLIDSINYEVAGAVGELELVVSYLDYGAAMETGVPASRIPFGGNGGGKTSKYIHGLMQWIRFKRLTSGLDKDIKSFAFAIAKIHKKKGMPSLGSFAFSSNGRRVGFQRFILEQNKGYITEKIQAGVDFSFETLVTDLVNGVANKL